MSFRFPLEAILRLRRGQQRLEELRLAALQVEIKKNQDSLAALEVEMRACSTWGGDGVAERFGAELHFLSHRREQLAQQRNTVLQLREALHAQCSSQQARLRAAQQAREVIESLRRDQVQLYQAERSRKEQAQADDRILQQRWRGEHSGK